MKMQNEKVKLAILDMNNDEPNQGLRCIVDIVKSFNKEVDFEVFNVRGKNKLPDLNFDIYISSGGPGSPLEKGKWRQPYLNLIQNLWDFNLNSHSQKKHVFFICYSFQVVCDYFELGELKPRKSTSFGILPVHKTAAGKKDIILNGLKAAGLVECAKLFENFYPGGNTGPRTASKVKDSAEAAQFLHSEIVLHKGDEPRGRCLKRKDK